MTTELTRCERIWTGVNLATLDPSIHNTYGVLENQVLGVSQGRIALIAPLEQVDLNGFQGERIDASGRWITPGLIDSHTHLVYGGNRAGEFEQRLEGASYAEIARAGGGILSTVRATRSLSQEALVRESLPRLQALIAEGVTTVEIKSGYGLSVEDELKMLRAARQLGRELPVRVRTTLLGAHALPPEYRDRPDDYVALVCAEMIPRAAAEGLADAVDVFCENIAFTPAQTEQIFAAAKAHKLGIKAHVEQLSNQSGAALAARYQAWSVDHLEHLDESGIAALAAAGTVACLLPGAFYFLRETQHPPIAALRRAGVPMALASDLNPGSSPLASLRLTMNFGCTLFGLTPEEALAGITRHAASALGLAEELGTLAVGKRADLLVWDIQQPAQLAYEFGVPRLRQRVFAGEPQTMGSPEHV